MANRGLFHIPAGAYSIGLSLESAGLCHDRFPRDLKNEWLLNCTPAHEVCIREVNMSVRHVSLADFTAFVDETGYKTEAESDGWGWIWHDGWLKEKGACWKRPFRGDGNEIYTTNAEVSPVLQASWNDAQAYCRWRSSHEPGCRLPHEAEWEILARMNGLPSIDDIDAGIEPLPYNDGEYMQQIISALDNPFPRSSLSLVWEWTQEWYQPYPGGPSHNEFGTTYKIMRGGSLRSHAAQRTCQFRFRRCPTARSSFYGFRCAFDIYRS